MWKLPIALSAGTFVAGFFLARSIAEVAHSPRAANWQPQASSRNLETPKELPPEALRSRPLPPTMANAPAAFKPVLELPAQLSPVQELALTDARAARAFRSHASNHYVSAVRECAKLQPRLPDTFTRSKVRVVQSSDGTSVTFKQIEVLVVEGAPLPAELQACISERISRTFAPARPLPALEDTVELDVTFGSKKQGK